MTQDSNPGAGAVIEMNTLPRRLKAAREDHAKLSQAQLAAITGISEATIYNYERTGEKAAKAPKRPYLIAWAMATGVDADWLITGESSRDMAPPPGLEPGTLCVTVSPTQDTLPAEAEADQKEAKKAA